MATRRPFLIDSSNEIQLGDPLNLSGSTGVVDQSDGSYVNDATVTLEELADEDSGADVSGTVSLPLAMPYVPGSNGVYAGTIPVGASVNEGQRIVARVHVVESTVLTRVFHLRLYGQSG